MGRKRGKYLFIGIFSILLILSACKYFDDIKITPAEAASAVLRGETKENKVHPISEEHMRGIEDLYRSAENFSLPYFEVTKAISIGKDELLERVIFRKDPVNLRWIMIPKKVGETDSTYLKRNCTGNYLLQDITIESKKNENKEGSFTVTTRIDYSEIDEGGIINKYIGFANFTLIKHSINQWSVESVDTIPFIQEKGI